MPVIEVEIADDGTFGRLPDPLQSFVNREIAKARRLAEEKTEQKMSPYLTDPAEFARLQQRDKDLAKIELEVAERDKKYEEAKKIREEGFAKEKAEALNAEKKNTAKAVEKVRAAVAKSIRAAALASGARAESLEELERLLAADIDLDDELNEYVVDAKDRKAPRVGADGQPVSIEGLVADYLKTHPHHVKAEATKSSGARGGATLAGVPPKSPNADARQAARDAVAEKPTLQNVSALLRAATSA